MELFKYYLKGGVTFTEFLLLDGRSLVAKQNWVIMFEIIQMLSLRYKREIRSLLTYADYVLLVYVLLERSLYVD